MAIQRTRSELRQRFKQGSKPSEVDFYDFIESNLNLKDDNLKISKDPNKPLSITSKGEQSYLLDFFDEEGKNTWRFLQKPLDGKPGLHITNTKGDSRLYIEEGTGRVGLGTTIPEANLQVEGAESASLRILSENDQGNATLEMRKKNSKFGFDIRYEGKENQLQIEGYGNNGSTGKLLTINRDTGNLTVKGTVTAQKFIGDGSGLTGINGGGGETPWRTAKPSDSRLKSKVEPLGNVLDKINVLSGVSFNWKEHPITEFFPKNKRQIGLIANDVEKVFPELVVPDHDGYKHLEYEKLTAVLLEGVKELTSRLEKLEK